MYEPIFSQRLELIPMAPLFLQASLRGDAAAAGAELSIEVPPWWPDVPDVLELRLAQLETDASLQPWLLRAMVLRDDRRMIGHIGFHTAPDPEYLREWSTGAVEFGFTVFEPFRRQGFASEAAKALMGWAAQEHGVARFVVSIRPDNVASQRLAAGLGFVRIGSAMDDADGEEDILELAYPPKNHAV